MEKNRKKAQDFDMRGEEGAVRPEHCMQYLIFCLQILQNVDASFLFMHSMVESGILGTSDSFGGATGGGLFRGLHRGKSLI
ncbi:MAG: hypothetical protein IJU28_08425 [Clostridia bacterium]|nr:hypothetical protein [Clostridia bacterium]